jgi:hypothetical protein
MDTSHLPQIFPQELKPFRRSMVGWGRLSSRFSLRAVLFEGWRTVRLLPAAHPRGVSSSRVRPVLASSSVDLSRCQSFVAGGLADRPPGGRGPSARHKLLPDSPGVGYGPSAFRGALLVVRLRLTDRPLEGHGQSTRCSRTIRPNLADRPLGLSQDS